MEIRKLNPRNRLSSPVFGSNIRSVVKFILSFGVFIYILVLAARNIDYNWQWYRIARYLYTVEEGIFLPGPLVKGVWVSFQVTAWSLLLSIGFGLCAALLRLSPSFAGQMVARVYLETVRNTPLLVQLFFLYFVAAPVLGISRFQSAVLALSLFEGAYASEIIRAGIVSIHRGQWEAAYSLGLGGWATYKTVILPQAIRRVLPPLTSQAISLVKDSALVSAIAVYDLTMQGRAIISETFLTFEVWFTVAAIYLMITGTLSFVVFLMKRSFGSFV